MQLSKKYIAICRETTLLRANQIARTTSHFKMGVTEIKMVDFIAYHKIYQLLCLFSHLQLYYTFSYTFMLIIIMVLSVSGTETQFSLKIIDCNMI